MVAGLPRFEALPEAERIAWARGQAEAEVAAELRTAAARAERDRRRQPLKRAGPGRPRWPDGLVAKRYAMARKLTPDPKTTPRIAEHFSG